MVVGSPTTLLPREAILILAVDARDDFHLPAFPLPRAIVVVVVVAIIVIVVVVVVVVVVAVVPEPEPERPERAHLAARPAQPEHPDGTEAQSAPMPPTQIATLDETHAEVADCTALVVEVAVGPTGSATGESVVADGGGSDGIGIEAAGRRHRSSPTLTKQGLFGERGKLLDKRLTNSRRGRLGRAGGYVVGGETEKRGWMRGGRTTHP